MQIQITLTDKARDSAFRALTARGHHPTSHWFGPTFEDAKVLTDHPCGNYLLGIVDGLTGSEYYYPFRDIARIKIV